MRLGSVILHKNGTGIYSKLQHWFSGAPYNHVSIYAGKDAWGKDLVFEASELMKFSRIDLSDPNLEIYEPLGFSHLEEVLDRHISRTENRWYAFFQILYFVRRKFYETKIGKKIFKIVHPKLPSPKKLNNWFPRGQICTETWYDLYKEAGQLGSDDLFWHNAELFFSNYLETIFDGNNLYVLDVREIMRMFVKQFKQTK